MGIRARIWPGLRTRSIWFDAGVAALSGVAAGVGATTPSRGRVSEGLLLLGALVLGVLVFLLRRRAPLAPFLASAALAALSPVVNAGLLITSYAVGRYVGRWPVRITAAVIGSVAVIQPWAGGTASEQVSRVATIAPIVLLPGAVGIYVRIRALLLQALRDRAERAEAERELLARDAVLLERTRIAREMHDAVGHRVSLMVLQAGAIEMAAGDQDRVEQLAGQVQVAGRQALEELRQMVGVLRAGEESAPLSPQPGLEALPMLVADSARAGMAVELSGLPESTVDAAVSRAAYRIVQEALTNAGKHAPGAPVRVCIERPPDGLHVRVVNGPGSAPGTAVGGGFGLVGLAERVRTLGGRLIAEPRLDGGFAVEAVLPG